MATVHDRLTGRPSEPLGGWTGRWADGEFHRLDPIEDGSSRDALESDDLDALEPLGQPLATAIASGSWTTIRGMPLLSEHGDEFLELQQREHVLQSHLPSIARVCERFVTRLAESSELLPVARVRRPARKALERLSAHTEDWAARTLSGPVPRRALAATLERNADLYENRMVTELVHPILTTDLGQRIRWLRRRLSDLADLARAEDEGTYRRRNRLYDFWGADAAQAAQSSARGRQTLQVLEPLAAWTQSLRRSTLFVALRGRRTGLRTLRLTNVIANDRHYRAAGLVWNAYERAQEAEESFEERVARLQSRHRTFDAYVFGLVARALHGHGYSPAEDPIPVQDGPVTLHGRWGSATLERQPDGVIVLTRGTRGTRFVPLLDMIGSNDEHSAIADRWSALERAGATARTVVVYLASSGYVRRLPRALAIVMSSASLDSPQPSQLTGVPVSPLETTSLERVARAVGMTVLTEALLDYPQRLLPMGERMPRRLISHLDAADITQAGLSPLFFRRGEDELFLRRPLTASESVALEAAVGTLRDRTKSPGWERDLTREIESLAEYVQAAAHSVAMLLTCPLCGTRAEPSQVGRERDIFTITCRSCEARWGHERCGTCEARIPIIEPEREIRNPKVTGPGWVERIYGQDALASPCWARTVPARYVCPDCRHCAVSDGPGGAECVRCHPNAASPASRTALVEH